MFVKSLVAAIALTFAAVPPAALARDTEALGVVNVKGYALDIGFGALTAIPAYNGEVIPISWSVGRNNSCILYAQYPGRGQAIPVAAGARGSVRERAVSLPHAGTGYSLVCEDRRGNVHMAQFYLTPNL